MSLPEDPPLGDPLAPGKRFTRAEKKRGQRIVDSLLREPGAEQDNYFWAAFTAREINFWFAEHIAGLNERIRRLEAELGKRGEPYSPPKIGPWQSPDHFRRDVFPQINERVRKGLRVRAEDIANIHVVDRTTLRRWHQHLGWAKWEDVIAEALHQPTPIEPPKTDQKSPHKCNVDPWLDTE